MMGLICQTGFSHLLLFGATCKLFYFELSWFLLRIFFPHLLLLLFSTIFLMIVIGAMIYVCDSD